MTLTDKHDRDEHRREQREGMEALEAYGALDNLYAMIDAGEVRPYGRDGLIAQLIKANLNRDLQTEHLGYDNDNPEASLHPNTVRVFEDAWDRFAPIVALPPMFRWVIYTTNSNESLNYQLRMVTKNRGHFPSDDATVTIL